MNDLVEVTDTFRRSPLIRFVQKGKGVTSLTGEKLYEAQAIESVRSVANRQGVAPSFFIMLADEERCGYRLFVEADSERRADARTFGEAVDEEQLGQLNIEYHSKRASGRLHPLDLIWVKRGTGEAFKAACVHERARCSLNNIHSIL